MIFNLRVYFSNVSFSLNHFKNFSQDSNMSQIKVINKKTNLNISCLQSMKIFDKLEYKYSKKNKAKRILKNIIKTEPSKLTYLRNFNDIDYEYFYKQKLLRSIINSSPHIVIDFRYETKKNIHLDLFHYLINEQLIKIITLNKESIEPFQLNFCNFNINNYKFKNYYNKNLKTDSNMIFQTCKSYLDIFPKSKLVYLTNESNKVMKYFDSNKIYIIGAIIDFDDEFKSASFKQAKLDQIQTLKLDTKYYLKNNEKSNTLCLYDTFKILTKMYNKLEFSPLNRKKIDNLDSS